MDASFPKRGTVHVAVPACMHFNRLASWQEAPSFRRRKQDMWTRKRQRQGWKSPREDWELLEMRKMWIWDRGLFNHVIRIKDEKCTGRRTTDIVLLQEAGNRRDGTLAATNLAGVVLGGARGRNSSGLQEQGGRGRRGLELEAQEYFAS